MSRKQKFANGFNRAAFWVWNVLFVLLVAFGITPATRSINLIQGVLLGLAWALPLLALFFGCFTLRGDAKKLFKWMNYVELPLLVPILFLLMYREMSASAVLMLFILALVSIYYAVRLFDGDWSNKYVNLLGASIHLWCGVWLFLLLIFFVPILLQIFVVYIVGLFIGVKEYTFESLFFTTLALFLLSPILLVQPIAFIYSAGKNFVNLFKEYYLINKRKTLLTSIGAVSALSLAFIFTTLEADKDYQEILEKVGNPNMTRQEKLEIASNAQHYKKALQEIKRVTYSYSYYDDESFLIQSLYEQAFDLDYEYSEWMQAIFNFAYKPFMYKGSRTGAYYDYIRAEEIHENLFEKSIDQARDDDFRESFAAARRQEEQAKNKAFPPKDSRVYLSKQEITLAEQGEWADLEIHEVYRNTHPTPQEIILYFQLPAGMVVNGLWLSDDETKKFPARVSPRGAARKVYEEIVRQRQDPALLEQIGPKNYKLRVFPIPGNDSAQGEKVMHLWLSLRALKQNDQVWTLPVLLEQQNFYWNFSTNYLQNGQLAAKSPTWLPKSLPVEQASRPESRSMFVNGYSIGMHPYPKPAVLNCDLPINVIIDTSFSMNAHKEKLTSSLERLDKLCANVRYYFWEKGKMQPVQSNIREQPGHWPLGQWPLGQWPFLGSLKVNEISKDISQVRPGATNIIFTDKTLFQDQDQEEDYANLNTGTWFFLLDNQVSEKASAKLTKRLYKVSGGLAVDLDKLVQSIVRQGQIVSSPDFPNVLEVDDRYIWTISPEKQASSPPDKAEPLAAHKLITYAIRKDLTEEPQQLDELQKVALQARIVTPFSSMIVLVEYWQEKLLEKAEKEKDRFEEEKGTNLRDLSSPRRQNVSNYAPIFMVSAVPEPEEWALIIAVSALLLWRLSKRRFSRGF